MELKVSDLNERMEALEKVINGEKIKREMVRKIETYKRDYRNYLENAEITDSLKVCKDENGGYLVPDEMEEGLVEALSESNVIRKVATVVTTSKTLKLLEEGKKPMAAWADEGAPLVFTDIDFYQVIIDAHKNGAIVKVSDELLADSGFDIEKYLIKQVGESIGYLEEDAFINGNGTHRPRGFLLDAEVGAEVSELTADSLIDLYTSFSQVYRQNAVWIMNDEAETALRKFKTHNGRFIWEEDVTKKTPGKLLALSEGMCTAVRLIGFARHTLMKAKRPAREYEYMNRSLKERFLQSLPW